jgi:phosphate starvation-inducible PhoH-like protein
MPKKRNVKKNYYEEIDQNDDFFREYDTNVNNKKTTYPHFKLEAKFKNKKQKEMHDLIINNRITFVKGPAGTGKTFVALLTGLELLKDQKVNLNQIVLTKPIVEIKSQSGIGALPGDLTEKTIGYFSYFYDNLIKIVGNDCSKFLKNAGYIKENVLNFVRGSTFGTYDSLGTPIGSFCLLDEAQNTTINEMKTFISRMGEQTKLIILGDPDQCDLIFKNGEKNGFDDAMNRLTNIDGIGIFEFNEDDIVRDPLLIEIMKRYKK